MSGMFSISGIELGVRNVGLIDNELVPPVPVEPVKLSTGCGICLQLVLVNDVKE